MFKPYFKSLDKFIKYRNYYFKHFKPPKNTVDSDLKFREDAEYNNIEQMLRRHNILETMDGLKGADYLEKTMDIHSKENNKVLYKNQ